jgi:BioD-like phosphotransacetylase family protein
MTCSSYEVDEDFGGNNSSSKSPVYVAATRQHVGKTSTSLALLSGLQKRFKQVGFMKPVGQISLQVEENGRLVNVDKDAVLVKEHFGLDHIQYKHTSPVLIPPGYTRNYLDGKILLEDQERKIKSAYFAISSNSEVVLCEGTGHCAVGSIVHASNAQVASWLGAKMLLVANGGLGNTFDELQLNKVLCDQEGVEICGVIVNKVQPEKLEQTRHYIQKALQMHWGDVPLLGCIPDRPFLGCPALSDLERLFDTKLLTGKQHRLRHYRVEDLNLVATSMQVFLSKLKKNPTRVLYVCHASRNDILLGFLMEHALRVGSRSENAMVVTGTDEFPLSEQVLDIIEGMKHDDSAPPVLLASGPTNKVIDTIHNYTPKLNSEDAHRASTAVDHYEPHIDFDLLLERTGHVQGQQAAKSQ